MKALWIRVEAHAVDSVKIAQLAAALRVKRTEALGLYTALGGNIAEHTDDGRINDVPDATIEEWGRWDRKEGDFARAVREIFQDGQGFFDEWRENMGKLVERRANDRERKRLEAERRAAAQPDLPGLSVETPRKLRGSSSATVRDGTERTTTTRPAPKKTAPARADDSGDEPEQHTFVTTMTTLFERFYVPDGKPPVGWDVERCGSIVRELRKHHGFDEISRAIIGFAALRDEPGRFGDPVDWVKPGEKLTMCALYATRTGVLPTFVAATNAFWKRANTLLPSEAP